MAKQPGRLHVIAMMSSGNLPPGSKGFKGFAALAELAIHGSGSVNGVRRLHWEVRSHHFAPLFPHWPISEMPAGDVTNERAAGEYMAHYTARIIPRGAGVAVPLEEGRILCQQ